MVVLGIDPGSVITGYGVVSYQGRKCRLVDCGCVRPSPRLSFSERLLEIHTGLCNLIAEVHLAQVALEATFYGANVQTLMKMCHARGAILLALAQSGLPVFEYAPREVKKAVVGNGGASKEQVLFMVRSIFGNSKEPETFDASDAVAVALCHVNRKRTPGGGSAGDRIEEKLMAAGARDPKGSRFEEKLRQAGVAPGSIPAPRGRKRRSR